MGKMKEVLIELQDQAEERHLAKLLGISYNDLLQLEWRLESEKTIDGLIQRYRIDFSDSSPEGILDKIERLEDGYTVYLDPWELEAEYDYINDQFDAITES